MGIYEKKSDDREYLYLKKQGQPSIRGQIHEIAALSNFHKAVEFIFLTKGKQDANLNGIRYTAEAGDIIFVASYVHHSYLQCDGVDGYILVLSDWFFQFYKTQYGDKTWSPILRNKEKNKEIFQYVADWHLNQTGTSYELFNKANIFLAMMSKAYEPTNIKMQKTSELTIAILLYIDQNFTRAITLEEIADEVGYTKQYCSKVFNETMGMNFRTYLNRKRIVEFNHLLENIKKNDENILSLALSCGFESQTTFYRAYREVFGTTPTLKV